MTPQTGEYLKITDSLPSQNKWFICTHGLSLYPPQGMSGFLQSDGVSPGRKSYFTSKFCVPIMLLLLTMRTD
jgi:hypothetical protein